jgi:hypothetical protein
VEATGELVAVRLSLPGPRPRQIGIHTHEHGLVALARNDPTYVVYVLAEIPGRETVERLLAGWETACEQPESLDWLERRLADDHEEPRDWLERLRDGTLLRDREPT